jgi:hypothetical protein
MFYFTEGKDQLRVDWLMAWRPQAYPMLPPARMCDTLS